MNSLKFDIIERDIKSKSLRDKFRHFKCVKLKVQPVTSELSILKSQTLF